MFQQKAKWLFVLTLLLLGIGVVFVYSASAPSAASENLRKFAHLLANSSNVEEIPSAHGTKYFYRQLAWAIASVLLMVVVYSIDYSVHKKFSLLYVVVSVCLLALVFVPKIGMERNGAHRWINLHVFQLQPSEFAKIALIVHFAKILSRSGEREIRSFFYGLGPMLVVLGMFVGLIIIEPDLGTCVVLGMIAFAMWLVGGVPIRHLAAMLIVGVAGIVAAIIFEPYRMRRILAFSDPEKDPLGAGYHLLNSLIAVGTGGLWGRGIGQGLSKYLFLSECHTDFIYSIICEEAGFVGATTILGLFLAFIFLGLSVAKHTDDPFGRLVAVGITVMIGGQALVNMLVAVGLAPTKGLALPLISYGGSSLATNLAAIGILLNIAADVEREMAGRHMSRPARAT